MQLALFITGLLWMFAARALAERIAQAVAARLHLAALQGVLEQALLVFLLAAGFAALSRLGARQGSLRSSNSLPGRVTTRQEVLRGLALGWAMVLLTALPLVLFGALSLRFAFSLPLLGEALAATLTLGLFALATELAFRGFLYQRLTAATGTVTATFLMALLYAFFAVARPNATASTFVIAFLFGILYCVAWQRTHALWVGWGVHLAWVLLPGIVFGLPVAGYDTYGSLVQGFTTGSGALTGGAYGLDSSLMAALSILAALPILFRMTRDYAWNYTHPEILPGGRPMDVQPPPAHAAMEAAPAPLVQIAAITPAAPSTLPEANQLLRRSREPGDDTSPQQ